VPVQPTAKLVVLFYSWHKNKRPQLPRLIAIIHVENYSGRFGNTKKIFQKYFINFPARMLVGYSSHRHGVRTVEVLQQERHVCHQAIPLLRKTLCIEAPILTIRYWLSRRKER
jgi:hypothetical protein